MSFIKRLRGTFCAPMPLQTGFRSRSGHPFTRRTSKRPARFIPALETLEARLTPSGDPLVQPQVLHSVNGVLNVTLTESVGPVKIGDHIVEDAWTYNGMYPGPTLALAPGDTLNG